MKRRRYLPKATIQLDKLIFKCRCLIREEIDSWIYNHQDYMLKKELVFGETMLKKITDSKSPYYHIRKVYYQGNILLGRIDLVNSKRLPKEKNLIQFTIDNEVFYNNTLKYLPIVLSELNLSVNNITQVEIAIDYHNHDIEKKLVREIFRETNTIKLLGKTVRDREKELKDIKNFGSAGSKGFNIGTIYIFAKKNNKNTKFGLRCYDKYKEIEDSSEKYYISEFHEKYNTKPERLFRLEIFFHYDELNRYIKGKKHSMKAEEFLNRLFDTAFLYDLASEYLDRLIEIHKDSKEKISILPCYENILNRTA
ncbi:MAG: hypothetical protein ACK5MK_14880 [Dysgonomonas sp.]